MIEKEVLPEREFVRKEFGEFGFDPDIEIVSIEPAAARFTGLCVFPKTQT